MSDAVLPELRKAPTTRQLVRWAAAVGDFNEHHYDLRFVQRLGMPDVLVHGSLQASWLAELVATWAGPQARIVRLEARYGHIAHPGDYRCGGRVVARDGRRVEVELWGHDAGGRRCVSGTAVVEVPETSDPRPQEQTP